jgi:hypothetical protein
MHGLQIEVLRGGKRERERGKEREGERERGGEREREKKID